MNERCSRLRYINKRCSLRHWAVDVAALRDATSVVGVHDEADGVVPGEGDVGNAADETGSVLAQRSVNDVVHTTCTVTCFTTPFKQFFYF